MVKNLSAMQEMHEMLVQSLVWEDNLEVSMATHSNILAWRVPWTPIFLPGGLQSVGLQRAGQTEETQQQQQS